VSVIALFVQRLYQNITHNAGKTPIKGIQINNVEKRYKLSTAMYEQVI